MSNTSKLVVSNASPLHHRINGLGHTKCLAFMFKMVRKILMNVKPH